MSEERDLIVIGSGPGGYVAAIRAAQLGLRTAIVEKDPKFGGTCLHRGCIPTKALLHTAEVLEEIKKADKLGIDVGAPTLDMAKAQRRKQKVVDKNAKGIEFLFKKNGVEGMHGLGRVLGPHEVAVERDGATTVLRTRHILVATGSVPRDLPFAPVDGERILSSDHVLELEQVPASLAVLGAGAVGTELASIYRSFGSEVTLVELLPRLLPIEDEDVSKEVEKAFRKRGITSLTGTSLKGVTATDAGLELELEKGDSVSRITVEKLLVAVGRKPVTEGLGLESLGIELEKGYIPVNETMQTSVPNIYAIGDVVPTPWLAHVASAEGILAVEHMAGRPVRPVRYDLVPSVTFCDPEVGSVGLTEAQAREKGYEVAVGTFPFTALGKAAILDKTQGFVKVVRETKYDELLGVHIVGAHATDLVAEACVALNLESTTEELFRTMHAHPTLAEGLAEAAHASHGHAIHF